MRLITEQADYEQLPNIVYYNDDHSRTNLCTSRIAKAFECTFTLPDTWEGLTREIEANAKFLAFHIDMISNSKLHAAEFISAIRTIHRFSRSTSQLNIMVIITPHTPLSTIRELQRLPVLGIGLDINQFPIIEVAAATREFLASTSYWPKNIINRLPGQPVRKFSPKKQIVDISPRQQQVLDLIKTRGLSNKQIARALTISENTVKMHVGDIMRVYGVRTRVQLAVLA